MPIDRVLKTRLFDPLEMKDTSYMLVNGGEPGGARILSPRLVELMGCTN